MLNQVVIVGRLANDINIVKGENENCIMTLAVPRNFKNADGEYDTDFIDCQLRGTIAKNTSEYCKQGDIVGIKGRIQKEDGIMRIVAEKVTFLSNHVGPIDE